MMTRYAKLLFITFIVATSFHLFGQVTFYDFTVIDINGEEFNFQQLEGKRVMVVNTASKCMLTPQYEDLEALYKKYGGDDFVIIGFPSNDFASQEPGTNEEIAEFCRLNYGVTFPMMSKISLKGSDIHPLYEWLTSQSLNGLEDSKIAWNFQKYLIDEKGQLVGHVAPRKKPGSKDVLEFLGIE